MSLPVLQVRRHGVIDGQDGEVRVCASVGPAGEVVAVWTMAEGLEAVTSRTVQPGWACFPDPGATRPADARITVHAPELAAVTRIADLALAHITVQPMPGDRFLVAGARCRWRRSWHTDIKGARALAVASSRVALFGGYGPDHDRLALAELGADRAEPAGEYRIVLPGGEALPPGTQVIGRGSRLHFLTGTSWYQLGMDDIPE